MSKGAFKIVLFAAVFLAILNQNCLSLATPMNFSFGNEGSGSVGNMPLLSSASASSGPLTIRGLFLRIASVPFVKGLLQLGDFRDLFINSRACH